MIKPYLRKEPLWRKVWIKILELELWIKRKLGLIKVEKYRCLGCGKIFTEFDDHQCFYEENGRMIPYGWESVD